MAGPNFAKVAEAIPFESIRKYRGRVVTVSGTRMVNVDGQNLRATWADPLVVDDGDVVDVEVINRGPGQSTVHVPTRRAEQPRAKTGTVSAVPGSSPTISVAAGDGITYDAEFIGSYVVGDKVHLDWGAGRPRVIGKVSQTPAPVPPPAPTPPAPTVTTGSKSAAAIESNTLWGPGGWGSWAGGGQHVFQGDYGYGPLSGAWFYGKPFASLNDGRTITRIRFRTGRRRSVGASNSAAVFHFYAHSSSYRPGGDVSRVVGPFDVTIQPGQAPTWINLPLSFAATLLAGGGIAVYGAPYAGMDGRLVQADSGALILDWKK
ncbi:minor tail protein [Arthrobacter phage Andrew]|uniref:Minor tail protein n=1 Tax=Arthrobacter phage Andrew TaxID=2419946 RepID=A0A3G2KD60_9CAUD|nr:minor tail protein [Arthrobacter phage Andrew]AYN56835.1 minor tail protein [Arthrobacter phage Andrew]